MTVVQKGGRGQDNLMKAMLASANATVNFARSGTIARVWNKTWVPFFNPAIQGTANTTRVLTGQKGLKAWTRLVLKMAVFGVLPTFLNNFIYKDDEDYKNLSQRDKDIYFLFKVNGKFAKVPKGRVVSVVGMAANLKDRDWGESLKTALDQTAPQNPFTSNIISPFLDATSSEEGRTWYGTAINNERLMNYAPGERFDNSTDVFSKAVGKALNISPKKINYILDSLTGVVGDVSLPLMTPRAEQNPIVKQFVIDPKLNNKISFEFYNALDKAKFAKNSTKNVADTVTYKYLNSHTNLINDLNAEIREIESSKISNKVKMEKVKELKVIINGIQKNATNNLSEYTKNSKYITSDEKDFNKQVEEVYRETNREVFGAEYALKTYNKDTYDKAQKTRKKGVPYDDFYEAYFATRGLEPIKDEYGKTVESVPKQQRNIILELDMPKINKEILDEVLVNDVTIIPKDVKVDYSNKDTVKLTQMSDAAQRKWDAAKEWGLNVNQYEEYYKIYSAVGKKAEKN